ncbi:Piwi-domain-containing protein [Hypoxylon trugodes]|uniref:Piwi-domain-containing protein n=1 Tax=Hypoxylon trugodes TaxID=326681 RepID=UPI00219F324A|nr:Piwi-domain-containing protein [Hypoxylon trugodes]KAI1385411.1 Piwi-domain-containing protein [Hypoxylon trugodes]
MSGRPSGSSHGSPARSRSGSQSGSRSGSPSRQSGQPTGFKEGTGKDPAKDRPKLTPAQVIGKRVDLPADAYKSEKSETRFTARPGYNTEGRPIKVQLNLFAVLGWQDLEIYQYDVSVSPNLKESAPLMKKVWHSKTAQKELAKLGGKWLYDGHKLAWSSQKVERGELRVTVDLDSPAEKPQEQPNPNKKKANSPYYLSVRQTKAIRLSYLRAYLLGKISWDEHVLECMNFFDHCLRQFPSEKWVTIKRNFYDPRFPVGKLSNDLVVNQGIYCAPRLSESIKKGGTGLAVNVDRCQTAFWPVDSLDQLAFRLVNGHNEDWSRWDDNKICHEMHHRLTMDKGGNPKLVPSEAFALLRRFVKMKFTVKHRGKMADPKKYTVKAIVFDKDHGEAGSNAFNVSFDLKQPNGPSKKITIWDYYQEKYGIRLQFPKLPIIETSKGQLFPMELCNSDEHQRYSFKLNPRQTSDMIKQAATRPHKRKADIVEGVTHLKWSQDPYLKAFGINISPDMTITDARLLRSPDIMFGNVKENPGTNGRWDLRGKTFIEKNANELKSWGFISCGDSTCKQGELEFFARQFSDIYRKHGGNIKEPAFCKVLGWMDGNYGAICEKAYYETGNARKAEPQIIFFVLPTKNQLVYERIKKNMDCRFNIVSQCLQAAHVKKAQGQYMSNVAMKVNSKLGGATCKVPHPHPKGGSPFWSIPTMMIGLDVSHGAAGSHQASMAALTMSMDKHATRFAASCQTNGYRQETVLPTTMHSLLPRLARAWSNTNRVQPQHIYFLRDGVSEGQFQDVLDTEVAEMKRVFREQSGGSVPKFTVIIATKRHHVRFFPKPGDKETADRNGNPLPGTLVERDVTHPQHFDFYLCSHAAIQGTARPVHYQVILDEADVKPNDLMKMIYQQCYQYCRSTTPVSLHPAVYYSHLASNRARSHENLSSDSLILGFGKPGFPYGKDGSEGSKDAQYLQAPLLLSMENEKMTPATIRFMNTTMWYV